MTREELLQLHREITTRAHQLMEMKNHDYAQEDSVFGNLDLCESLLGLSTEMGILVRMGDKLKRLGNFFRNGSFQVKSEMVSDNIEDIINYAVLLAAKIQSRREQNG